MSFPEKRIIIITCWYGTYPWYLPYFIHSCKYNPAIDFCIITDNQQAIEDKPENVKIVFKTITEVQQEASIKLGFTVNIDHPYKFCDFKPAYGFIFPELIKGYSFWGQSDIDIIFGNIRDFITDEMLSQYDFISLRHDYTTGCFALYRNNHLMNSIFKRSKDYRTVFSDSEHYCFDECNFAWDLLTEGKSIFEIETKIESFTHVIKSAQANNEIKAHFDFILMEGIPGRIKFDGGKIIYKNKFEAILYHLYWLKKVYDPGKKTLKIPDTYFISPSRIYF